ncbi:hypothetical protein ACH4VM_36935 [Streptomyces sp. NPDC020792]|uniref:hypothetical protein n=1 Tax=Streptomyces sp. NPDC020792 TaxID=3365089 RepID=UPI00378B8277
MDTGCWQGLTWEPLRNAVDVTLAHNDDLERHQLPVSTLLPEMAAPLVEKAFYPFTSGTNAADRVLTYSSTVCRTTPQDAVLARAAESGWGLLELPARHTLDDDPEAAEALAATAARLLTRGALSTASRSPSPASRSARPGRSGRMRYGPGSPPAA